MRYHVICSVYDQTGEIVTWIDGKVTREKAKPYQCEHVRLKLFRCVWEGGCTYVGTQAGPSFGFLPY